MIFRFHPRALAALLSFLACLPWCTARAELWRTGYYTGWEQDAMPPASIDFSALTHIIHFSLTPNADGTLNATNGFLSETNSRDLVTRAHAAGVKVLVCLGGSDSQGAFQSATSPANLPVFLRNITNFLSARGYDGVDIDWEPLPSADAHAYTNLVTGLRSALNAFSPPGLLTAAVSAYPPYGDSLTADYQLFAAWQNQFDQINIMTYDLSGPYSGWVTWFNSPLYDGGFHFPNAGGRLLPSVEGSVRNYLNNGVAPGRLGIAIAFYGYVWNGRAAHSVSQPRQSWTEAPTAATLNYNDLMALYYATNVYHWDAGAGAAYLSVTNADSAKNVFVSFDDPRACRDKVDFARAHNLGGVIMWELAQDHKPGRPDPLLQAVKQAMTTLPLIPPPTSGDVRETESGLAAEASPASAPAATNQPRFSPAPANP